MKERDKWEDEIRSKLKDFEVDTDPGDWKAIAERLPGKKVMFSRRWYYVAAGIAMFLLMSIGYYYYNHSLNDMPIVAEIVETETPPEKITEQQPIKTPENNLIAQTELSGQIMPVRIAQLTSQLSAEKEITEPAKTVSDPVLLPVSPKTQLDMRSNHSKEEALRSLQTWLKRSNRIENRDYVGYLADATPAKADKTSGRRWGFGVGGGNYSVGTNGGGFTSDIRLRSASGEYMGYNGEWYMEDPVKRDDYFNELLTNPSNSEYYTKSIPKVGLKHKQPISFGIGIGYALDDRWSLQSGLVYTLLSSEWRTELSSQDIFKQHLHFVGVPLGVSYKIAEWNNILFYTTAGGMAEWNIAGNIRTNSYSLEGARMTEKESVRIKETQWSVDARVGATYPVIKFLNAYVEGGVNHYFDNKSSLETIRSDKPFHVSLQAGLRFGF